MEFIAAIEDVPIMHPLCFPRVALQIISLPYVASILSVIALSADHFIIRLILDFDLFFVSLNRARPGELWNIYN
ncbi:MAG: hypothetical protein NTY37_07815 [Methanothrix sp.]|nr:hypothetical protein [Methanothrix sp.]